MKKNSLIFSAINICFWIVLIGGTLRLGWPVEWTARIGILSGVGVLLFFLVRWHAQNYAYKCSECDHKFSISTMIDFISPHFPDKKYLRCPACHKRCWCHEIDGSQMTVKTDSAQPHKN